ncbi:Carboxylesterase family protein [Tritrichomonas foetus]|uniref:Carboxylic ester hydrolase n=1 Tax=Tritrichomonas foetus TaxID=1144522 RepID=A0A1J4JSR4_9EUKA|nr:Carboxylesterase family protein [Tritrichomonas foetus]|eukprot:OHT02153.1 Carboxylesterase family protein [Tritrichomonas foetus]
MQFPVEGGLISGVPGEHPNTTVFKGVPYAAPPIGELRWKPPQPVIPWDGVRKCNKYSTICPQPFQPDDGFYRKEFYDSPDPETSEDCLYLNIWAPTDHLQDHNKTKAKLPVAIYIHGGSFDHGWGYEKEFDGEALTQHGVIFIAFNYRVNIFGFLTHPILLENEATSKSGVAGVLDAICCVKWVYNNIEVFGGDKNNISLFGQSAGSILTTCLSMTTETKGIIKNIILQSGITHEVDSINLLSQEESSNFGAKLLEPFNVKSIEDMYKISTKELIERFIEFDKTQKGVFLCPSIDGNVLVSDISSAENNGSIHPMNIIIGFNSNDIYMDEFSKSAKSLSHVLTKQGKKIYVYYFNHDIPGDDKPGGFHSAELWYMFGTYKKCWRPFDKNDADLSEKMVKYWSNFFRTGSPNSEGLFEWPCVTVDKYQRLELSNEMKLIE